ncbi:MAG: hypothetical protein ABSH33_05835 [Steroidobacteraceae bacterium]|jgi:hypothetical protein
MILKSTSRWVTSTWVAAALAAIGLVPGIANAGFVLDTGVPDGSTGPFVLSTAQFLAGEFAVTAGEDITDLSAYLSQGAGEIGDTFTFDIYSSTGFTNRPSTRPAPVFSATGTFTSNGTGSGAWQTTAVNWTPTAGGDYWLALQVASTTDTKGLDAPGEATATTGTVPALGFAYAPASGQYTTSGAPAIGLEVTAASPVPLPAPLWLFGSGLLAAVGCAARRRRGGITR